MNLRHLEALAASGVTILDPSRTVVEASVEIGPDTVIHPDVNLGGDSVVGINDFLKLLEDWRSCP